MKIRNGFVSNSSSSSFIICGFEISRKDEINGDQKCTQEFDTIDCDNTILVGKELWHEESFLSYNQEIDKSVFDDLKVRKAAEVYGKDPDSAKIFVGEYYR